MYIQLPTILFIFLLITGCANGDISPVTVINLRCEYLRNPLGIDIESPRLSWELISGERGQEQVVYQILVDSDSLSLLQNRGNLWNSKKTKSNQTNQVIYSGQELTSRSKVYWKVRIWDKKGRVSNWSSIANWSVGLLNKTDWQANWIGAVKEKVPDPLKYYIDYGYQSAIAPSADAKNKWISIDLGTIQHISEVRLYPVQFNKKPNGYLFPLKFRIDLAENADFDKYISVADETESDYNKIGLDAYTKKFNPVKAQFIRVWVSKMPAIDSSRYAYALAELEVWNDKNKNVALRKVVTASDVHSIYSQFSNENWLPARLTDGFLKNNEGHKSYSLPVPASPLIRKTFKIDKKINNPFLYVTALGLWLHFLLNG